MLCAKGSSGFSSFSTAEEVTKGIDASGLTAIVTGASSGIGAETARVFALRGVRVILGVRNISAGRRIKEEIVKQVPTSHVDVMELDLSSMVSVRKFASEFKSTGLPLNLLINNAGISVAPFRLSADGIELQFATNHLGHFLLTDLLLDVMKDTSIKYGVQGRIVNVSSIAHFTPMLKGICFEKISDKSSYNRGLAYLVSKLANVLHANELSRRFQEEGVNITANSLHPGLVRTNLFRHVSFANVMIKHILRPFIKDVHQGAATTCYIALHSDNIGVSGKYFSDCNVSKAWPQARNKDLGKKLWEFSMNLIKSDSH